MRQVVGFQLFLCELNSVEPFLYFSSSRDGDGFDVVGHMLCLIFFFVFFTLLRLRSGNVSATVRGEQAVVTTNCI